MACRRVKGKFHKTKAVVDIATDLEIIEAHLARGRGELYGFDFGPLPQCGEKHFPGLLVDIN